MERLIGKNHGTADRLQKPRRHHRVLCTRDQDLAGEFGGRQQRGLRLRRRRYEQVYDQIPEAAAGENDGRRRRVACRLVERRRRKAVRGFGGRWPDAESKGDQRHQRHDDQGGQESLAHIGSFGVSQA